VIPITKTSSINVKPHFSHTRDFFEDSDRID
jgi:hypothetical protein